jgi:hypothetical protein
LGLLKEVGPDLRRSSGSCKSQLYVDPKRGVTTSGRTPSLDDAKAQFLANWHKCRTDRLLPHALLRSRTKCPTCICVPCQRASFHHACRHQRGSRPPAKDWLHEIKHDGFRVIARKIGNRVRLYSRSGGKDVFPLLSPRAIKISPCRMRVEERSSNKQRIHRLVTSRADAARIAEHSSNVDCPAIAPITVLTSARHVSRIHALAGRLPTRVLRGLPAHRGCHTGQHSERPGPSTSF